MPTSLIVPHLQSHWIPGEECKKSKAAKSTPFWGHPHLQVVVVTLGTKAAPYTGALVSSVEWWGPWSFAELVLRPVVSTRPSLTRVTHWQLWKRSTLVFAPFAIKSWSSSQPSKTGLEVRYLSFPGWPYWLTLLSWPLPLFHSLTDIFCCMAEPGLLGCWNCAFCPKTLVIVQLFKIDAELMSIKY